MSHPSIGVALIGCGNIAGPYLEQLTAYSETRVVGVTDMDRAKAEAQALKFKCRAYASVDELLADRSVEMVINLTIHTAHKEVTARCLDAGKHVYSEKPMALSRADATELVELARQRGLRLGAAPITYLGETQQTAWKVIRGGKLGKIRLVYAELNWGCIETWHPAPVSYYKKGVGPLWDCGVYPLTLVTAFLGPARKVWAYGTILKSERITLSGERFHVEAPDFSVVMIELEGGVQVRLTSNFYVGRTGTKQSGVEFHGDAGTLYLREWFDFKSSVEFCEYGKPFEPVPLLREAYPNKVEYGRGPLEMARAILENRPHRPKGEHAAHVVEILEAATTAMCTGGYVGVESSFPPPDPMEWAL